MFFRRSLVTHLFLGVVGMIAFAAALHWQQLGWPALILFPVALIAWQGCPTCWLMGVGHFLSKRGKQPSDGNHPGS